MIISISRNSFFISAKSGNIDSNPNFCQLLPISILSFRFHGFPRGFSFESAGSQQEYALYLASLGAKVHRGMAGMYPVNPVPLRPGADFLTAWSVPRRWHKPSFVVTVGNLQFAVKGHVLWKTFRSF